MAERRADVRRRGRTQDQENGGSHCRGGRDRAGQRGQGGSAGLGSAGFELQRHLAAGQRREFVLSERALHAAA